MKYLIATVMLIGIGISAANAHDLNPPPWRYQPNTTYARWDTWYGGGGEKSATFPPDTEFSYLQVSPSAVTLAPEAEATDYAGIDEVLWISDHDDKEGLTLELPNYTDPNPYKEIVLQVTWHEDGPPGYSVDLPASIIDSQLGVDLGGGWFYDYIVYRIEPNPVFETITLTNPTGDLYIDQVVVDTICAPEPASITALILGAMIAIRRKH